MLTNSESSYGLISRIFHWTMSILIITMLVVGFVMTNINPSEQKWEIYNAHKATGLIILFLIILRILWTLSNTLVRVPIDLSKWQKKAARWNHILLYILMLIMPISGSLMSLLGGHDINFFNLFIVKSFMQNKEISKLFWNTHVYSAFILIATLALHIAAALYHHFVRKDNVLVRMVRGY